MTCETPVPFDVDALIQNVQGLLERLKKIKKDIQQPPHSGSASQSKTKRTQPSFDPITISQTLRYIVEEAQRLEAELASPSHNVNSNAQVKDVHGSNTQNEDAQNGGTRVGDTHGGDTQVENGLRSDIQENMLEDNVQIEPFHRDGQQHPPPTNPEVPSFQSHPPRNLRRRPPPPTMKQPQQTIPRARTCSGRHTCRLQLNGNVRTYPIGLLKNDALLALMKMPVMSGWNIFGITIRVMDLLR
ncbi:hypothetical protein K469DRAFT_755963 [Zopfia rhizophila CBS 207.26]|uniref:Uncharacterized protein n=1 Tax=Zopfia rhizophila CBS 207.26 TaxID=1314779 RepID=A0A6A6D9Y0_9PEZI|nr:hypothetical protein K469DRAFT_755963 [Zopfia rhizophila CBS 207.26]